MAVKLTPWWPSLIALLISASWACTITFLLNNVVEMMIQHYHCVLNTYVFKFSCGYYYDSLPLFPNILLGLLAASPSLLLFYYPYSIHLQRLHIFKWRRLVLAGSIAAGINGTVFLLIFILLIKSSNLGPPSFFILMLVWKDVVKAPIIFTCVGFLTTTFHYLFIVYLKKMGTQYN